MGNVALAQAIAHSQAQDQDLVVGQLAQAFASGLAKGLVPPAVLLRGQGQSEVVFRKGLNAGAVAKLGDVPVLKDADEPWHQKPLAVVARQYWQRTFDVGHQQMNPKLGYRAFMPLTATGIQSHSPAA